MRGRNVAILIDGGFFLKRLPKLVPPHRCDSPEGVTTCVRIMCRSHVKQLTGDDGSRWHDHVYRIFFYDAVPYDGQAHHPLLNRQIDFGKSDTAKFRNGLFDCLRRQRNVALRLGKVIRESDWAAPSAKMRRLMATQSWISGLDLDAVDGEGRLTLSAAQLLEAKRLKQRWLDLSPDEVRLGLRQKGVDMRIGLDIASITLKKQADTIVLVAGDSDFVPAAKLARREGIEFILDPMWQSVNADLFEHIDGLQSGLARPGQDRREPANDMEEDPA